MSELRVQVTRKTFVRPPTVALQSLEFEVASGSFVAVVGPSGAGKTTLMNILAGLDSDFEGEVELIRDGLRQPPEATRVGYVFQTPRLMPWLSVMDNLRLVLHREEQIEAAQELLEVMGLREFTHVFPGKLSGGMRRRVALARAFAVEPELLLLDEPFVSLDAPTAWRLRAKLMEIWRDAKPTVVYVTHDLREALTMAERVLFLSERPAHVVLDRKIQGERDCRAGDVVVEALHEELLAAHPDILTGLAVSEEESVS